MTGGVPLQVATRLLAERTGMRVTAGLSERLAVCLDAAARASGRTPEGYAAALAGDPAAFQELLDRVTVQQSGFFRHPDQLAALGREVLPALEGPVVIWSAGCGNGQEAYSLAMELAASGHRDWQVLATDISAAAVARARSARYTTAELAGLPAVHRHWLRPAGGQWEIAPTLRHRVRFERSNLTDRFPAPPGRCQVVFCRNVLIYLSRAVSGSFLDRLAGWLAPGGLVFLGYSEAVLPPTHRLRPTQVGATHALRADPEGPGVGGPWTSPGDPGAASHGDPHRAVAAFRRAVFADPDRAAAWFQLGVALEAVAGWRSARRAYAAGLAALERCDHDLVEAELDGWRADELAGVLRAKLKRPAREARP